MSVSLTREQWQTLLRGIATATVMMMYGWPQPLAERWVQLKEPEIQAAARKLENGELLPDPPTTASRRSDLQHALYQMLEYCIREHSRSQQGYFSPGGWAYEQAAALLCRDDQDRLRELYVRMAASG